MPRAGVSGEAAAPKPGKERMKRPEGMSREVRLACSYAMWLVPVLDVLVLLLHIFLCHSLGKFICLHASQFQRRHWPRPSPSVLKYTCTMGNKVSARTGCKRRRLRCWTGRTRLCRRTLRGTCAKRRTCRGSSSAGNQTVAARYGFSRISRLRSWTWTPAPNT